MTIVLVRHGETEWSASGQHTSTTDLPLTENGRAAACALAGRLARRSFAVVLTSPRSRARETCELAGLGAQAEVDPDLVEWDYGEYEGLTTKEIQAERPDWSLWRDGAPGGETERDVSARADRVINRVLAARGDVALFAHGHILRVVGARWLEFPAARGRSLALSTASLSELGFEHDERSIWLWNAT